MQIKITLRLGCSPVNLQQIFRTPFPKNTSRRLVCNFIEITLRIGCSPANLLHFFRTTFPKNTSGRLPRKSRYLRKSSRTYSKIFQQKIGNISWNGQTFNEKLVKVNVIHELILGFLFFSVCIPDIFRTFKVSIRKNWYPLCLEKNSFPYFLCKSSSHFVQM